MTRTLYVIFPDFLSKIGPASFILPLSVWLLVGNQTQAQSFDYGDAPDSYGTLLNSNGPRHKAYTSVYLGGALGSVYDAEPNGQPGPMADGDDSHDQDGNIVYNRSDEDGLVKGFPAVCLLKSAYTLQVSVYNNSGADATVSAWIDLNKNGTFELNERAQAIVPSTPNLSHYNGTPVTLVWNGLSELTEGWTFARLRVANSAAEVANPTGLANSGEVEDYRVQLKDEYDFGDAPESYGTRLRDNGARHLINNNLMLLGALDCSADDDGRPTELADGDADENAARFPYKLTTTKTSFSVWVDVLNTSGANAMLSGWIDFNRNGVFEANERAQATVASDARNVVLNWSGLSGLTAGRTYARFRVACQSADVADPTGFAGSGAVEDYTLMIEPPQYDYGDAPDTYGTVRGSNGPRHLYNDLATNLSLGSYVDPEADGQPSSQADGDDTAGFSGLTINDENGLLYPPTLVTNSTSCSAVLSVNNRTGAEATVSGWIDFNQNGVFEASERAQATIPANQSENTLVELHWDGIKDLTAGQTFMRFRLASNATEVANPTGVASDGEVEDYPLTITTVERNPMPVDLISFQGQWIEHSGNQLSWVTAWEKNNDHFEIQRSRDARSFETVGRVIGKGTSAATQAYAYVDEPGGQAELQYYRLKQVDWDSRVTYSPTIAVRHTLDATLSLVVYPNPASEQVGWQVSTHELVRSVQLYNVGGRAVIRQDSAGAWVDIRSLPAGTYILEVMTTAGQVLRQRFVKQ